MTSLTEALPSGLAPSEAIALGREQGALVGIPHPFDRSRRSLLRDPANAVLVPLVDWIEARNGRVAYREADEAADVLARRSGIPAIGTSDAHTLLEVGTMFTTMLGDPSTAEGLLAALRGPLSIHVPDQDDAPATRRGIRLLPARWVRRSWRR